jgi:RNA processing factor Prp31
MFYNKKIFITPIFFSLLFFSKSFCVSAESKKVDVIPLTQLDKKVTELLNKKFTEYNMTTNDINSKMLNEFKMRKELIVKTLKRQAQKEHKNFVTLQQILQTIDEKLNLFIERAKLVYISQRGQTIMSQLKNTRSIGKNNSKINFNI